MNLTVKDYKALGVKEASVAPLLPFLNKYMEWAEINTPKRVNCFLATVLHETADFFYKEEIADGSAYEGRTDLGNTVKGYGKKYKGRGPIQITGYKNYESFTKWVQANFGLKVDLVKNPELVATNPEVAVLAAIWFWLYQKLNDYADKDQYKEIQAIVNAGSVKNMARVNHMKERIQKYDKVKKWMTTIIATVLTDIA